MIQVTTTIVCLHRTSYNKAMQKFSDTTTFTNRLTVLESGSPMALQSQVPDKKRNDTGKLIVPVLSGGGTRLTAHIGILRALQDMDYQFTTLVGVSGGSIVSSLFSAGMSLGEIKELAMETEFAQFRSFSLFQLIRHGGMSTGDRFEQWIDEKLGGATFDELAWDLNIIATDVNGGGPVVFNRKSTPGLRVSAAVRFSMSVPLVFTFKPYRKHLLVDGAILAEDALQNDWAGDGTPVICFRLRSEQRARQAPIRGLFPIKQYVMLLIRTFMTALSREYVNASFWNNTIVIDTGETSPVDFTISPEQKQYLYQQGYDTTFKLIPVKFDNYIHKE